MWDVLPLWVCNFTKDCPFFVTIKISLLSTTLIPQSLLLAILYLVRFTISCNLVFFPETDSPAAKASFTPMQLRMAWSYWSSDLYFSVFGSRSLTSGVVFKDRICFLKAGPLLELGLQILFRENHSSRLSCCFPSFPVMSTHVFTVRHIWGPLPWIFLKYP